MARRKTMLRTLIRRPQKCLICKTAKTLEAPTSSTGKARKSRNSELRKRIGVQRVRVREETRAQMLERLTNPTISLHETSVILGVCSATVRHYADNATLPHTRTEGRQRRFRLRDVLSLARALESKKRKRA